MFNLAAQRSRKAGETLPKGNHLQHRGARGVAGCGTAVLLLHAPHPDLPDMCCLRGGRWLCPLCPPVLQLSPPAPHSPCPPGPSPLCTPSRCEQRPLRQMATFGRRAVPGRGTFLGSGDQEPPPHPARFGNLSLTAASTGQAGQGVPGVDTLPVLVGCLGHGRVRGGQQPGRVGVC